MLFWLRSTQTTKSESCLFRQPFVGCLERDLIWPKINDPSQEMPLARLR